LIVIKENLEYFKNKVLDGITDKMNSAISRAIPSIQSEVTLLVLEAINRSDEVISMRSGKLRYELGFINPDYFINGLLNAISKDIKVKNVKLHKRGNSIAGGIQILIVPGDYSSLLGIPEASYRSGINEVPWLRWLLLEGTSVVVSDYHIEYGSGGKFDLRSRTKRALMVPNESYSVPSEYSGTDEDNFITRAIEPLKERISKIIINNIEKNI
jgi:hypothetical protein